VRTLLVLSALGVLFFALAVLVVWRLADSGLARPSQSAHLYCREHWSFRPESQPYLVCWQPMF